MRSLRRLLFLFVAAVLAAGACTAGGATATPASSQAVAVATLAVTSVPDITQPAATSPAASPSGGPGASATPPAIDPCSLLTQDEATTAVGAKVGSGVSSTAGPDRVCTWKTGLIEVKLFLAPPAPDAATAQAYWDAGRSEVPSEIKIADISGVGDRAAYGSGSASGFSVSALFVIKGTWFFDFYCGIGKLCPVGASVTAANLIIGRLP